MISTATTGDLHAIAEMHVLSWQTAYRGVVPDDMLNSRNIEDSVSGWRSTLQSYPENITVAKNRDGVLVGFCCAGAVVDAKRSGPFEFEIYGLHVTPQLHRQGIGTSLIANAFARMGALGFRRAVVWTLEGLVQSRRFYEKRGGVVVNTAVWEVDTHKINEVAYGFMHSEA
jgi:ribosomal protein S18 acetylase RimI-like enzyme